MNIRQTEQGLHIIYGIEDLDAVADALLQKFAECQVFALTGSLGAGKTSLVQRILRRCGVQGVMMSPTFTYVNRYANEQGQTFYHFDCYRINSLDQFIQAGFDEYLFQPNSWSFIEWPEVIYPLLSHRTCFIDIEYHGNDKRSLTCRIKE